MVAFDKVFGAENLIIRSSEYVFLIENKQNLAERTRTTNLLDALTQIKYLVFLKLKLAYN
jgi:hypothetical protein